MNHDTLHDGEKQNYYGLSPMEFAWLRRYGAGMQLFVGDQLVSARKNFAYHASTMAIIACRKALEVPTEKYPFINTLGVAIADAATDDAGLGEAERLYRSVCVADKDELLDIEQQAQAQINDRAVDRWSETLTLLTNDSSGTSTVAHCAGIAAMELARVREEPDNQQGILSSYQRNCYRIAANSFRRRKNDLPASYEDPKSGAESDEIDAQLLSALSLLLTHYTTQNTPVKDQARNELIKLTYEIDDNPNNSMAGSRSQLEQSYELLARSSRLRERRYFRREAAMNRMDGQTNSAHMRVERAVRDKRPKPRR